MITQTRDYYILWYIEILYYKYSSEILIPIQKISYYPQKNQKIRNPAHHHVDKNI